MGLGLLVGASYTTSYSPDIPLLIVVPSPPLHGNCGDHLVTTRAAAVTDGSTTRRLCFAIIKPYLFFISTLPTSSPTSSSPSLPTFSFLSTSFSSSPWC